MGMFDHFEPRKSLSCPVCGDELVDWQGKDGPRDLVVWREGQRAPVEQRIDEEWAMPPEALEALRLPAEFMIYTYDTHDHRVVASGRCVDGVWTHTELTTVSAFRRTRNGALARRQLWPVVTREQIC